MVAEQCGGVLAGALWRAAALCRPRIALPVQGGELSPGGAGLAPGWWLRFRRLSPLVGGVPNSCYWANTLLKPSAVALLGVSMAQHSMFVGLQV